MLFNGKDSTLAVDLGPDAVRVVSVQTRRGQPHVAAFAEQSLADGNAANLPDRHLDALASVLSANGIKTRRVVAAMPTTSIVTRTVQIDTGKSMSPEEQIQYTLQNCLPDAKDLAFDYWRVSPPRPNEKAFDVLVVATQASLVERYLQGFEKLQLSCAHMDVAPCAIAALIARTTTNPDSPVGTIALSPGTGFFAIIDKGQVLFWRPFDTSAISKSGATTPQLERMGEEISKCVSHMVGAMGGDNLGELLIFGRNSGDAAIGDYLKNRFNLNVRAPSPFDAFASGANSSGAIEQPAATNYCTAVGLALQKLA